MKRPEKQSINQHINRIHSQEFVLVKVLWPFKFKTENPIIGQRPELLKLFRL